MYVSVVTYQIERIYNSLVYIRTHNLYYNAFVIVTMDCEMMESVLPFNHLSGLQLTSIAGRASLSGQISEVSNPVVHLNVLGVMRTQTT